MTTATCIKCQEAFEMPAWQKARGDYRCTPCMYKINAEWRHKRRRAIDPSWNPKPKGPPKPYKPRPVHHTLARRAVSDAIAKGQMVRGPCEVCGTTTGVEGHHDDYDKVFEVRWLCHRHHQQLHSRLTAQARAAAPKIIEAAKAHVAARAALEDANVTHLSPDDPRFKAVSETLAALTAAVAMQEAA